MRLAGTLALTAAALLIGPTTAAAAAVEARLQGTFAMEGRITRAVNVRGERRGMHVRRRWTFESRCPAGACAKVTLLRTRAGGRRDRTVLHRVAAGVYRGSGRLYVPLRCNGHVHRYGGRVPYEVRVRILAARAEGTQPLATGISARYVNRRRINLTPCPGGIGSDAARYHGSLAESPPPAEPPAEPPATEPPPTEPPPAEPPPTEPSAAEEPPASEAAG